jgi:integrase
MARTIRNGKLDTRSARVNLRQRKSPYWAAISPGFALGYRKGSKGWGVWLAKLVKPGFRQEETMGSADDALDPDGVHIFSFAQAQEKAREWKARIEAAHSGVAKPKTVRDALDSYEADLKARNGEISNVGRLRVRLGDDLLDKPVASLTWTDLRQWRDGLVRAPHPRKKLAPTVSDKPEKLSPATINRTCGAFKAALNHVAADPEQRISNKQAWERGLESFPDAKQSRNVILPDPVVHQLIAEAHSYIAEFGFLVEVAAVTGARCSQIARLNVADLQADSAEPRLMMPSSRKGKKGAKLPPHHPVPIAAELAKRLQVLTRDRVPTAPLLMRPITARTSGGRWKRSNQDDHFEEIVARCGLTDPDKITFGALRHSSIVRQIKKNVPIRIIAVNHNTSVAKIESNYSAFIGDHTDAITRAALLDAAKPIADNVVPIRGLTAPL